MRQSSHSARKAFAGNMYKNVKDPNLVCALTGHKEGSITQSGMCKFYTYHFCCLRESLSKAFKIAWDLGSYAISLNS